MENAGTQSNRFISVLKVAGESAFTSPAFSSRRREAEFPNEAGRLLEGSTECACLSRVSEGQRKNVTPWQPFVFRSTARLRAVVDAKRCYLERELVAFQPGAVLGLHCPEVSLHKPG